MKTIAFLWREFKMRPDEWLFYAFLVFFPLSIRKILYFVPINDRYNEFASISVYASDIFLVGTLLTGFIILYNNNIILSSVATATDIVPRGTMRKMVTFFKKIYTQLVHNYLLLFPLIIVILSFLSTAWAQDVYLAIFKSFKLLEFYLLFLYVYYKLFHVEQCTKSNLFKGNRNFGINGENVPRGTFFKNILKISLVLGVIHAFLGILQILAQKSLGLFWLKESIITADMTGVAKVVFNGEVWIRAYGLFPHPNVLGGFLVFTIICTIIYFKLFHPGEFVPRGTIHGAGTEQVAIKNQDACSTWNKFDFWKEKSVGLFKNCSTWNNSTELDGDNVSQWKKCSTWNIFVNRRETSESIGNRIMFHVEQSYNKPLFKRLILATQILAIILTFSKSAIFGLIIATSYILYKNIHIPATSPRKNCSTWNNSADFTDINASQCNKCSTWNNLSNKCETCSKLLDNKLFHVEQFGGEISKLLSGFLRSNQKVILWLFIILTIFVLFRPNYHSLIGRSISDRLIFLNVSRETFFEDPLLGIGAGQYVVNLLNKRDVLEWQYEPVHNVFLLMLNELGLMALLTFIFFVYRLFHVEQSEKYDSQAETDPSAYRTGGRGIFKQDAIIAYSKGLLLALIVISLFDHYLWTIQQGQVILWLTLALLATRRKKW